MGKGDKKTKKGKIFMGSYGVTRRRKKKKLNLIINKKKAVTAKSTLEKAVEEKSASKGKEITKQPVLSARLPDGQGAEGTSTKKTQAKSGTKKTTSKKIDDDPRHAKDHSGRRARGRGRSF